MLGSVDALWIKRTEGGSMAKVETARAVKGAGLEGNFNQGGRRQVTVLSAEAWDAVQQRLALGLDPSLRRANVLVSGIDLEKSRNRVLNVGLTSILIHGETKPCNLMEAGCPGLRDALTPHWRGGAYGEVLTDGEIRIGDRVAWKETADRS